MKCIKLLHFFHCGGGGSNYVKGAFAFVEEFLIIHSMFDKFYPIFLHAINLPLSKKKKRERERERERERLEELEKRIPVRVDV